MIANSRTYQMLDRASAVHRLHCDSLAVPDEQPVEIDPARVDEAVMRYGMAARSIYSDLKRVIGLVGGLLILAQSSQRRDAFDLPSLAHAEELCREACDRLARLSAPGRLDAHHSRLLRVGEIVTNGLSALRGVRLDTDRAPELAEASMALASAYALLQSTSDSRFGMMMVDLRHACCNCGAINNT